MGRVVQQEGTAQNQSLRRIERVIGAGDFRGDLPECVDVGDVVQGQVR
jgi:hypothetical protein